MIGVDTQMYLEGIASMVDRLPYVSHPKHPTAPHHKVPTITKPSPPIHSLESLALLANNSLETSAVLSIPFSRASVAGDTILFVCMGPQRCNGVLVVFVCPLAGLRWTNNGSGGVSISRSSGEKA
jgi:hypothetical protein